MTPDDKTKPGREKFPVPAYYARHREAYIRGLWARFLVEQEESKRAKGERPPQKSGKKRFSGNQENL